MQKTSVASTKKCWFNARHAWEGLQPRFFQRLQGQSRLKRNAARQLPRKATDHSCRNARSRGFTLLEVLVAFLVLSLSMSVLMRIVSQSLNALATADHHQVALQLAESKLAEVLIHLDGSSRGKDQGRLDRDYRWQSEIEPYEFDNQEPGERYSVTPLLIRVSVSWGRSPAERVSLSTIRLLQETP